MFIKKIEINTWQQFDKIDISFDNQLTILTWANWSWKTTILNTLSIHFWWNVPSCATPELDMAQKAWKWISWFFSKNEDTLNNWNMSIGNIYYSDDWKSRLVIPRNNSAQYQVQIENLRWLSGFFIPSHRSIFRYQQVATIPTQNIIDKTNAFNKISNNHRDRYFWSHHQPSSFFMKETLISWNIFWQWNKDMVGNSELLKNYNWFEEVLRKILPSSIGFNKFSIRNAEVIMECESWSFMIDASSWWISAIIDIAWQIFMYSTDDRKSFTVIIDEIENHLHPTLQRELLPNLIKAFPWIRFIVSTHSPLMVGSVKNANVYVLKYNNAKKVTSFKLDILDKAKTATDILNEVLWVSFTMPIWAEEKLDEILKKFKKQSVEEMDFNQLRKELSDEWLWDFLPEAITRITNNELIW
jgi:predicted ATP-dependent endonuclease of OLD family